MIAGPKLLVVILASGLLSPRIVVGESRPWCPTGAKVNLTGLNVNSKGFIEKSGDMYPPNATWSENGETFGCPCKFKTCLPFCCPFTYATNQASCVKDRITSVLYYYGLSKVITIPNPHVFIDDPCNLISATDLYSKKINIPRHDGSVYLDDVNRTFHLGEYCLLRPLNALEFSVAICDHPNFTVRHILSPVFNIILILFALGAFILYTVIPELDNLQGSIFRAYLASYMICLLLLIPRDQLSDKTMSWIAMSINVTIQYFAIACTFWLTVMIYNIRSMFRGLQSNSYLNTEEIQKVKFVRYSIFVWGTSIILVVFSIGIYFGITEGLSYRVIMLYHVILPSISIDIYNTYLLVSTVIIFKRYKREIMRIIGGSEEDYQENKRWLHSYIKLFAIMVSRLVLYVVGWKFSTTIRFMIVYATEILHGIFTILMLVSNEDAKRSLFKQFTRMWNALVSFFRRDSTTAI